MFYSIRMAIREIFRAWGESGMSVTRRNIIAGLASVPVLASLSNASLAAPSTISMDRFDPWIEVDAAALAHNVKTVARLAGNRPILAVIKNNAYGLGLATVASVLEPMSNRDIQFSLCTDDAAARVMKAARKTGRRPQAHFYLDTGMSRMGIPYHRALPVLEELSALDIDIKGTFMGFTEETEFDREQLRRFTEFTDTAKKGGAELGSLHAASSHAVFNFSDSHLDQVRPGIALFGAYPSDASAESQIATLKPAVRLQARIVRTEQLRAGDSVSYGGHYVASKPTWVATVPAGHTDGIPRSAVDGSSVLVNGKPYPVIGAVSASHTIIELGDERSVSIGDLATLLGSDHESVHPNELAATSGTSVYDILMHLNPSIPKVLV